MRDEQDIAFLRRTGLSRKALRMLMDIQTPPDRRETNDGRDIGMETDSRFHQLWLCTPKACSKSLHLSYLPFEIFSD
ncbi:uncharacterized protein LOC121820695 [Ovis aries]|uniref:uncharacterized protein LOC121820695 n=1 Tax=Ovis aries TaxID=9940 RepID=UPI0029527833|nr:uncharacterized protein LOC121820695 [Ovis aries]